MFWKAVSYQLCHPETTAWARSHLLPLSKEDIQGDLVEQDQLIKNTVNFMKEAQGFYVVVGLYLRTRVGKQACGGEGKGARITTEKKKMANDKIQYQRE